MLEDLRKKINSLDRDIIELLIERIKVVEEIAHEKIKNNMPLYRSDREQVVYQKISDYNNNRIDQVILNNIYKEIMSAALNIEGGLQIAYLGPPGSFTHQAAIKKFGNSLKLQPLNKIEDVFDEVQKDNYSYGVIPIENSTEGIVNNVLDNLLNYDVTIYAEINLQIKHNLIGYQTDFSKIKEIHTHEHAYPQCKNWLTRNIPQASWHKTRSTSDAVKNLSKSKSTSIVAIGSESASLVYNVPIIKANIEDYSRNHTRFIVISKNSTEATGNDRTSLVISAAHKPGMLHDVLTPIHEANINLTSIESRPAKNKLWNYIFYIDMECHESEERFQKVLKKLEKISSAVKILGSYPKDITE